jgi:hypothetical protein
VITPGAAPFIVEPTTFTLAPGRSRQVTVQFTPVAANVPSEQVLRIRDRTGAETQRDLTVSGLGAVPEIAFAIDTLRVTLTAGDSTTRSIEIENRGALPLTVLPSLELDDLTELLGRAYSGDRATHAVAPTSGRPSTRAAAGRSAVLAASTPVRWLQTLLDELGFTTTVAAPEGLTPPIIAIGEFVVVALDGGWVSANIVGYLADAARAGALVMVLGGSRHAPFVEAMGELIGASATQGWTPSDPATFVLRAPTGTLTDSLPLQHVWNSLDPSTHLLRVADPAAAVLAVHGNGDPALVVKRLGLGSFVLWTGTPNDLAWTNPADLAVIRQIVANAARASSQWVRIPIDPFTVPPHGAYALSVRFNATAQNPGTFAGHLRFDSDDPARPIVRVPIRLVVTPAVSGALVPSRGAK